MHEEAQNNNNELKAQKLYNRKRRTPIYLLVIGIFVLFLYILGRMQVESNKRSSSQTEQVLLNQVESVIISRDNGYESTRFNLQNSYVTRAKAVAYILQYNADTENDIYELGRLADLLQLDEINIFNKEGLIIKSTRRESLGVSMDDGPQIGFFKPMLRSTALTLCQFSMLNTSGTGEMMYAAAWKEDGSEIVQIGIDGSKVDRALEAYAAESIASEIPVYNGMAVIIAEWGTQRIIGATDKSLVGIRLDSLGISDNDYNKYTAAFYEREFNGTNSYITLKSHGPYVICITQDSSIANEGVGTVMLIVTLYLLIAAGIVLAVINIMTRRIEGEIVKRVEEEAKAQKFEEDANFDKMTGLPNRRLYELARAKYTEEGPDPGLVYASIDLNCLKATNDGLGHDAGDELIRGAADVLKRIFSPYGEVYRNGGDEFAVIMHADDDIYDKIRLQLKSEVDSWQGEIVKEMGLSAGYASVSEFPLDDFDELVRKADKRMYLDKDLFYRTKGIDRRGSRVAYDVMCSVYSKILRVDLEKDSFIIVKLDASETKPTEEETTISGWFESFMRKGQVAPEDLSYYMSKTDLTYIKKYFASGKKQLTVKYRRLYQNSYKPAVMEMLPDKDYSSENQVIYLYVKSID